MIRRWFAEILGIMHPLLFELPIDQMTNIFDCKLND